MTRPKVTPETFDAFLAMRKAGVKQKTIAEILGVSAGTVYCMSSTGSYEKYREWANHHLEQMKQRKAAMAKVRAKEERERALQIAEKQREAIREAEAKRSKWNIFGKKRQTNTMKITFEVEVTDDTYELVKPATSALTALFNRDGESRVTVKTNE